MSTVLRGSGPTTTDRDARAGTPLHATSPTATDRATGAGPTLRARIAAPGDARPGPGSVPADGVVGPGHPLALLLPLGLGDVRLVAVPNEHLGVTSAIALVGDPLASIAPLVHLHRGCLLSAALGHGGCRRPEELTRAFRRLREDGAGVLVVHRDDRDPLRACCADAEHRRRPLGEPERSPALDVLAATLADLGLRPARLLIPAAPDPDALDPRDVRLPVVRHVRFGGSLPRPALAPVREAA